MSAMSGAAYPSPVKPGQVEEIEGRHGHADFVETQAGYETPGYILFGDATGLEDPAYQAAILEVVTGQGPLVLGEAPDYFGEFILFILDDFCRCREACWQPYRGCNFRSERSRPAVLEDRRGRCGRRPRRSASPTVFWKIRGSEPSRPRANRISARLKASSSLRRSKPMTFQPIIRSGSACRISFRAPASMAASSG